MFRTGLAPYPFTYHLASEITPFVYEPSIEKGTPFWRSLPIEAFIRISPRNLTSSASHVLPTPLLTRFNNTRILGKVVGSEIGSNPVGDKQFLL